MKPFTVILGADQIESAFRLVGELRTRGVSCVVVSEPTHLATAVPASACVALAAAGISTVVVGGSFPLLEHLRASAPQVLVTREYPAATIDDLRARGWIPAEGEAYTDDELETVTARLQELGYA